ncbi:zinc finger protein 271 isoform X2 [Hippoglossus stenolepis]|uniref:zinc finger protein 271 isoform X2 n=1 Tax=Hippoglossus stenolepis TaxID=195615 RepID=UPI001FAED23F|nr:zinc finger protein 271 isoform X2 [Hippoglossus stenolepis]
MDGAAAATTTEEEAGNNPPDGHRASENDVHPPTEDPANDRLGVFCCQDCEETFREEPAYLEHRQQHLQENVYLDDQLDGLSNGEKDKGAANFCTSCSLSFVEPSEFDLHMEKNHGQTSQKESGVQTKSGTTKQPAYECPDCGKCYMLLGHFLNHQRSHLQASKSVFRELEDLKKKSFKCETCGRSYSRASALDAHRRCHEEKLFKSRNRKSGDSLPTEELKVEAKPPKNKANDAPEKTFQCPCGKAFPALSRMKAHQRFSGKSQCSTDEFKPKPKKNCGEFHCSECEKTFTGHIALFNHQRWHDNRSKDSAKRFLCEQCGKDFMTLAFYYRHQRMAHSDQAPAKSFLHQVCQLQKKAFECKECGLKFSRASALQSHLLHHTEVFRQTEKGIRIHTSPLSQHKELESEGKDTENMEVNVESERLLPTSIAAEDSQRNESDEDMESYEPGDFNVQVISASESEDESVKDHNPDLELLCESDQESRDDGDTEPSSSGLVSKPEMDLKIVQVDFEQADEQCALVASMAENEPTKKRFNCPDCYRWFTSASSLRVHRMWHGIHKRRQTQDNKCSIDCEECGLKFTDSEVFKTHLHQHSLEEEEQEQVEEVDVEEALKPDNSNPAAELLPGREDEGENRDEDDEDEEMDGADNGCDTSSSSTKNSDLAETAEDASSINKGRHEYCCNFCGKLYTYLVSYKKHLQQHEQKPTSSKPTVLTLSKYECPHCDMSFHRRTRLRSHLTVHALRKSSKKTPSRCDQCNKVFLCPKLLLRHMDLHKKKPFWCLSCAIGFRDELSLDKHLQNHSLRQHKCDVCQKRFQMSSELMNHSKTHTGAKPHMCSLCGKGFSYKPNLIRHQKEHFWIFFGSGESSQLIKNSEMKRPAPSSGTGELLEKEKIAQQSETRKPCEVADEANSEESDCGEPLHYLSGMADPLDWLKTERVQPQEGQETNVHREHKYWEWECVECDMGFDDVAKLHLHYVKHATGELPFPQFDVEG